MVRQDVEGDGREDERDGSDKAEHHDVTQKGQQIHATASVPALRQERETDGSVPDRYSAAAPRNMRVTLPAPMVRISPP